MDLKRLALGIKKIEILYQMNFNFRENFTDTIVDSVERFWSEKLGETFYKY